MNRNNLATQASNHITDSTAKSSKLAFPVTVFLISLTLPFIFQLGDIRLSVYRIILLPLILPLLFFWVSGGAGRIRVADIALLLLCLWGTISFSIVHGVQTGVETGGIMFIETIGPYLLARCYIRDAFTFRKMVVLLFLIVLTLMPFAFIEAVIGRNILLEFMDGIWPSYHRVAKNPRWGLQRVQATFEHPILFGVFCGSAIGLTHMVLGYGQNFSQKTFDGL